jgi:signal peptidase I
MRAIPRPDSTLGKIIELVVIVGLAIGLALLIQAYAIKPYQIPSVSMLPTLERGQRVLVSRFIYHFDSPSIGDIVVFHPPEGAVGLGAECADKRTGEGTQFACDRATAQESDTNFIKRIVAGPGDRLKIIDGRPLVRSQVTAEQWRRNIAPQESYIDPCRRDDHTVPCELKKPITIPKGEYFMMGDNRGHSDDSRLWGPIPQSWIVGEAFMTYWPPGRIGFL